MQDLHSVRSSFGFGRSTSTRYSPYFPWLSKSTHWKDGHLLQMLQLAANATSETTLSESSSQKSSISFLTAPQPPQNHNLVYCLQTTPLYALATSCMCTRVEPSCTTIASSFELRASYPHLYCPKLVIWALIENLQLWNEPLTAIFPERVIPICLQQPNFSRRQQELLYRLKLTPLHIHTQATIYLSAVCLSLWLQDFTLPHWTSLIPSPTTIASSFELQASYPPLYYPKPVI